MAGLPLLVRLALTAQRSGAARVIALGGDQDGKLSDLLGRDPRTRAVEIHGDAPPELPDGDVVALLPSDCLITPSALARAFAAADPGRALLVRPPGAGDGWGVVVGPPRLVAAPLDERRAAPLALDEGWCMRVRDDDDARAAERRLIADLRAATAETDGPLARFDRALSTRLSRLLVHTPLRPNHVTSAGTLVGLAAAWCIARGSYAGGIAGALLFWLAVIIDGCDGEVARLKMQESRFGYLFDVITDNIVHAAIFLAIGVAQYRIAPTRSHALLGALLLGGLALSFVSSYFCLIRHPPVRRLAPRTRRGKIRKWLLLGFEALMNRDFAYVLLPLALVGRLHWFLWGAAIGSHVFSGGLFLVYRWRDEE